MTAPREWDADVYHRVSAPLEAMGRDALDRLVLRGDERVLDAGCGSGRVTAALLEQLPRGEVLGVDGSLAMVERARREVRDPRARFAQADLVELALDAPVDAILSTATFHWILDHDALFRRLHAALAPGGQLVAQCGGEGNIAEVRGAVAAVGHPALEGWPGPWRFASPADAARGLRAAGFEGVWTWPHRVTVRPDDLPAYLGSVVLGSHLERIPAAERAAFVAAVAEALPRPEIDYVRLNLLARKPS